MCSFILSLFIHKLILVNFNIWQKLQHFENGWSKRISWKHCWIPSNTTVQIFGFLIRTEARFNQRRDQGRGWRGSSPPPLAIRIFMFIFLVFHQHCKSRLGSLQNVLWQKHKQNRRQEVVNRGDLRLCGGLCLYVRARGLDIPFWQISLIQCFIFQFVGLRPPKLPVATGWVELILFGDN